MRDSYLPLTTGAVAKIAGIHRDTLLRWLRQGLIPEPSRNIHGWRVFTHKEAERVIQYSQGLTYSPRDTTPLEVGNIQALEHLNWDFLNAVTNYGTHGIHPYPAKYIPQIPNALIQELSVVEETVADIFCGSGTTLVEALMLKRHVVGVDANPLACLISKAKTIRLTMDEYQSLYALSNRSHDLGNYTAKFSVPNLFGEDSFVSSAPRPFHPMIGEWFYPFVVEELAEVLSWCLNLTSENAKTIALTAFSSIIVTVSKQESDTRYARVEKNINKGDTFKKFSRALFEVTRLSEDLSEATEPRFTCNIIQESVLAKPDIGSVDLVVCSPPYPNAYSYHLYHASRMIWLGMNQPKFKQEEIGSHRKYSSKSKNAANVETFKEEMASVFRWIGSHLKLGRYACFVIGNSRIKGEVIDNANVLSNLSTTLGFQEKARIKRTLQSTKKYFNPAIGSIREEYILILKKVGNA